MAKSFLVIPLFFNPMAEYSHNNNFTIVPLELQNPNSQYNIIDELFTVSSNEEVCRCNIEYYNIQVIYKTIKGKKSGIPTICKYLSELPKLSAYNKVIVEYNVEPQRTIIAMAEGERLLIANSYHTVDFGSAIYYLLECFKQNQINPKQTIINLYAALSIDELNMLHKFVKGVKVCAL